MKDRPTILKWGGLFSKQADFCEEVHKFSPEANICATCQKPDCKTGNCKSFREEKQKLKEVKNEQQNTKGKV